MLLVTGPAGSGKTSLVLSRLREAVRLNDSQVRLLAPTATMARHVQNRLAREGVVLRPGLVQTLSRFIEPWAADLPQVSEAQLYLIVEAAARRVNRQEFARVAQLPGFCASLARTLEEFSSAGCDAERLARHLPAAPLGNGFLAVYEEVERELKRRGLAMRSARLERAAARIGEQGLAGIRAIWLDGFQALPDPELAVIAAMARHADLTLTLPAGELTAPTRARLLAMGCHEQACESRRSTPVPEVVEAPAIEREADEMARRILEQAAAGRPFREMGIIVRQPEVYEAILRVTLERFGIPARLYMEARLGEHGVVRYLAGMVDAMLGGWEHAATLAVLRMDPALGNSNAMDRLDFQVREQLPGRGLRGLKELASDEGVEARVARLESLESWRNLSLAPEEWARRIRGLEFKAARPDERVSHAKTLLWRSQAAARKAFDEAMGEAAAWFGGGRAIALGEFWRVAKAILRLSPLRLEDERRNVVHVLSAYEARQWELASVFVCGLVEKQFPAWPAQNAFFGDAARRRLQEAGVRLRTTADIEMEEEALFESAITRATASVTLSYPKFDQRGEQNLPSVFLERFGPSGPSRVAIPRPVRAGRESSGSPITAADLRDVVARKHQAVSVSAVESYVQCPFQFFGRYTLRLREPPRRPEDRLDTLTQGIIVHRVIAAWLRAPQPIEPLFDAVFAEVAREKGVTPGYRTEALREQMRQDLARFAADGQWPAAFRTRTEEKFEFQIGDGIALTGRIDRVDQTPDGKADIIDYKYSKNASDYAKNTNRLQGPLYLLAAEKALGLEPGRMFYCGLRGAVKYFPQPLTREQLNQSAETTLRVVAEAREGTLAPHPADLDPCRYCTFKDVCRYEAAGAPATAAEGA